jgi:adenylate cyclase
VKKKSSQSWTLLLIPLGIGLFFLAISFSSFSKNLDNGLYDNFLHIKPPIPQSKAILLLDVDDHAIDGIGAWPWPRNFMADGLITMKEMGVRYAVFDIEYINPSPPGVNRIYLENGLKSEFQQKFGDLKSNIGDLFTALRTRQIPLHGASDYVNELMGQTDQSENDLYNKTLDVAIDNDLFLGEAMAFQGSSYVTLNLQRSFSDTLSPQLRQIAVHRFSKKIDVPGAFLPTKKPYVDFLVPVRDVATRAKDAGFTNVPIDPDGKRRRIRLVEQVAGHDYTQLAFTPLLDWLGDPQVTVYPHHIDLTGAHFPDGKVRNVQIPLDQNGNMLINWPHATYLNSFTHRSYYDVVDYRRREVALGSFLDAFAARQSWQAYPDGTPVLDLSLAWKALEAARKQALASGNPADVEAFLKEYSAWLEKMDSFDKSDTQKVLFQALDSIQSALTDPGQLALLHGEMDQTRKAFVSFHDQWTTFKALHDSLKTSLDGKFVIMGWTGTGTSDLGTNPFDNEYVNVGTHASVVNTILERQFLSDSPIWIARLLMVLLPLLLIFLIRNLSPLRQNLSGLAFVLLLFGFSLLLFVLTGVYFQVFDPLMAVFLSFVVFSLVRFFSSEREKSFLRKAFGTYLSGEVINQLVDNPEMLQLGGQEREMTAMFTDVRGFSTISEQLEPSQLVALLNRYLSAMSDLVLNNRGTIDKYEGDAIIGFWGAPLDLPDHPRHALLTAIRMKEKEEELNRDFLENKLAPTPLLTRIGINSGKMVVGNMGTERKMDYTIMGNTVNLAARLEGVNKRYGTWIMTTDFTLATTGSEFVSRRLDRVRVVGIQTPVQLREVLGLRSEVNANVIDLVEEFHQALALFEARDWGKAVAAFEVLARRAPSDGPTRTFLKMSQEYLVHEPPQNWDGVFNLAEK